MIRTSKVERLVARRAHFDAMRAGVDVQLLEDAVEVVDDADVVAVHVDLGVARLDLQAKGAFVRRRPTLGYEVG